MITESKTKDEVEPRNKVPGLARVASQEWPLTEWGGVLIPLFSFYMYEVVVIPK